MIQTIAVQGFRSLRELVLGLGPVTLVTGANGSGKSSLYRSLSMLAETASGNPIGSLARQGGLQSVLWAGPENISQSMRTGEVPVQGTDAVAAVSPSGPMSAMYAHGIIRMPAEP